MTPEMPNNRAAGKGAITPRLHLIRSCVPCLNTSVLREPYET